MARHSKLPAPQAPLEQLPSITILELMHRQDRNAVNALKPVLPRIAQATDMIAAALQHGGRLFYLGAGTSGRLGALDAAECPPTFGTPPDLVRAIIAGGPAALTSALEGAEDDRAAAGTALQEHAFCAGDILVGISASGTTPFVLGGLEYARSLGAQTIAVTCSPGTPAEKIAHCAVVILVGPEIIAGSTRLKAGTATKLVLNMLSTAVFAKLGRVYGNLMIRVQPKSTKLKNRMLHIVMESCGLTRPEAMAALQRAKGDLPLAMIMQKRHLSLDQARKLLRQAQGNLRLALDQVEPAEH